MLLKQVFRRITELVKTLFRKQTTIDVVDDDTVVSNETRCRSTSHTFTDKVHTVKFYSRCSSRSKPTIKFPKMPVKYKYETPNVVETEYIIYHSPNIQYDESEETVIRRNRLRKRFREQQNRRKYENESHDLTCKIATQSKDNVPEVICDNLKSKHRDKVESAIRIENGRIDDYYEYDEQLCHSNSRISKLMSFSDYDDLRSSTLSKDEYMMDPGSWSISCILYYYPLHVLAEIYDFVTSDDGKHFECKLKCSDSQRKKFLSSNKPYGIIYGSVGEAIKHMKDLFIRCEYVLVTNTRRVLLAG